MGGTSHPVDDGRRRHVRLLSVVLPVRNEATALVELHERLSAALCAAVAGAVVEDFELVWVDDGSVDGSWQAIEGITRDDPRSVGVRLSRGFGQVPAVLAGMAHTRGDSVAAMDTDLELLPEDIGRLLDAHRDGRDLVTGVRPPSRHAFRQVPSRAFNRAMSRTTGTEFRDLGCGFVLMDRAVMLELAREGDLRRNAMVVAAAARLADRHAQVEIRLAPGTSPSAYGLSSLLSNATEAMWAFGRPLRVVLACGTAFAVASAAVALGAAVALAAGAGLGALVVMCAAVVCAAQGLTVAVLAVVGGQLVRSQRYRATPYVRVREVVGGAAGSGAGGVVPDVEEPVPQDGLRELPD